MDNLTLLTQDRDGTLAEFVGVADELKTLIETENDLLTRGLPVGSLSFAERKKELKEEYAVLIAGLLDGFGLSSFSDPDQTRKLRETGAELQVMAAANIGLLKAALTATQRRIDSVMAAAVSAEKTTITAQNLSSFAARRLSSVE